MSYILEALKKAQAERQIGSTPTIHAPSLASVPAGQGARSKRTPVIVAMALMAAAIAGLATMLVRQQPAASQPPSGAVPAIAVQAPTAQAAPAQAGVPPAAAPVVTQAPATPVAVARPVAPGAAAASSASLAGHAAIGQPVPQQAAQQVVSPRAADAHAPKQAGTAARGADAAQATPAPAPATAPAPVEEQVQALRELPEPIQRAIPQITLGGYMYSKNPADRLLLIDKVLRREGEEVAPGLILDKLQPKQAVFSFRGYRYRVPL